MSEPCAISHSCNVFLATTPQRLHVRGATATLQAEFDRELLDHGDLAHAIVYHVEHQSTEQLHSILAAIVEEPEKVSSLTEAVDELALRPRMCDKAPPSRAIRLRDVLAQPPSSGLPRGLIYTSTECLWLPLTTSERQARWALRMFVSRLPSSVDIGVYGTILSGGDVVLLGDDCTAGISDLLEHLLQQAADPTARSFLRRDGDVRETGRVTVPKSGGVSLHGRLSVADPEALQRVDLDGYHLYVAQTRSAAPNLGGVRPLAEDAQYCAIGTGISDDRELAQLVCRSEGIERFVIGDPDPADLHLAAALDLDEAYLDPRSVAQWDERQRAAFGLCEFDPAIPEWWTRGARVDRTPVWVPAALVYCPFTPALNWQHPGMQSSSGAASHSSIDQARFAAWLELVERDAFSRHWYGRQPPRVVSQSDEERLPELCSAILRRLRSAGAHCQLGMTRNRGVPVVFAAHSASKGSIALGASAARSFGEAAVKALKETLALVLHPNDGPPLDPTRVRSPRDHARLYTQTDKRANADWWFTGGPFDGQELIEDRLSDGDLHRLMVNAVAFDFQSTRLHDFHVSRVIDPQLIPLCFGFDSEPRGRRDFAQLLGSANGALSPHPFA